MKKIKVRFARIVDNDINGLLGDFLTTLASNEPNDNIVNDEQALLKSTECLLLAFNRGRELNSTLRKTDGTDGELVPPDGSRATETMYALINGSIMAFIGTQYPPSPARFVEYFRNLYKQKNNEEYRAFSVEEIHNEELLNAIKRTEWSQVRVAVVVSSLPDNCDDTNMFGKFICEGRRLGSKTLRYGMTDGIGTTIKNAILTCLPHTSSAYAKSTDRNIGLVNLHKYRFTIEARISDNETIFGTFPQILERAMNEYNRGNQS